jgi:RNA polymerase sigma-70 factor, ECF subfamily
LDVHGSRPDDLYREAIESYGAALVRLARAYEADSEARRDLVQDIHVALWRSFNVFDGRCSLRTWLFRVAHNVATSHVMKARRRRHEVWTSLEDLELASEARSPEDDVDDRQMLERLLALVRDLRPLDRQVMLSYLEGLDAKTTAEITGLSSANVATRIHRIKRVLTRRAREGADS